MELDPQRILRAPVDVLRFVGQRLLGGGWSELPSVPESDIIAPVRANIQYIRTGESDGSTNIY